MKNGKYIIIDTVITGYVAIMFDSLIAHSDFLKSFNKDRIISAGFFQVKSAPTDKDPDDILVSCWGKSVTLNLESKTEDEKLLKRVLRKEENIYT